MQLFKNYSGLSVIIVKQGKSNTHMNSLQDAKQVVLDYCTMFDNSSIDHLNETMSNHTGVGYSWRGMHPFYELTGVEQVCDVFWKPLRKAFSNLQRRPDVFLAGSNSIGHESQSNEQAIWVCQMGHFMGLFDQPWLSIPPTQRMAFVRYAEFHRVENGQITETALFLDLISVMRQAGHNPLPPQTGASFIYPGPQTHDGLLLDPQDADQGINTQALINRMISDLSRANQVANETNNNSVPPSVLAQTWHDNMIWYGPEGIGATYTIDRYQHQHQHPFRFNLTGKTFNGHVARFSEGNYGCFFGWPNLTNSPSGGFLGLPGNNAPADMRVVDVYRRYGDKLAENWVIIDLPHWLSMQGLDVLARMRQLLGEQKFK